MKFIICVAVKDDGRDAGEILLDTEKLLRSFDRNENQSEGRFDSFEIIDCVSEADSEEKILNEEMLVRSFVTPQGKWIEGPFIYDFGEIEGAEKESYDKWIGELKVLLEQCKDCWFFIVSCHS